MPVSVQRVVECVRDVEQKPERLMLIVGRPGSGKSKIMRELATMRGWKYVDARSLITEEILDLVPKVRAQEAPLLIAKVLNIYNAEVILLDGIQALFAPVLQVEPMELLKQLGRKFTIVAAWPGSYDEGKISFAYNGQADYRQYDAESLQIIDIG